MGLRNPRYTEDAVGERRYGEGFTVLLVKEGPGIFKPGLINLEVNMMDIYQRFWDESSK